ncbi:MAG: hypothetical protein B6I20_11140, partial [Bacteroidetes bacterium 4572_117]
MNKVLLILSFVFSISIFAQNQNPPDILWKSITSENFKVIFPAEIENEAQRITNTLEWVYKFDTKTLGCKPKPISLVLYNRSNISNAYAALSPRRMGWYLTPPQTVTNLGSVDWAQLLAVHEYRHVVQYAKNRKHFTKFVTYFFGDIGQSMMRWSIPDWFFEGDAITMETALTDGGRGRIPAFSMALRAYSESNEKFSYDQAYLGSYKRYYPSHYHLGYPLTAYGRVNYGADIWDNVLERTAKTSYWPYAFGNSVKKYTGLNLKKFYNKSMAAYDSVWANQVSKIKFTEAKIINKKKKRSRTSYFNPQYDINGNIIAGKESLDKIAAFYKISPDGTEKKIKNTDAGLFQYSNGRIIWSRTIPDIRWGEQAFEDIAILNVKTNQERLITNKGKYMSPTVSPDGSKIAAVKHTKTQETFLVILHSGSGKEINSYQIGDNDYIRTPVWSTDGNFIAFTHSKYKGLALSVLKITNGKIIKIYGYSSENIGRPVFYHDFLLYNSNYSGIGNIYAINMFTQERYQVTSRKFGAYNACVSETANKMLFQDYTQDGFDIAEMDLNPEKWVKLSKAVKTGPEYYKPLIGQEAGKNIFNKNISFKEYPVSDKYRSRLKFHSWGVYPAYPLLDVSIMANNYLKTSSLTAGYLFNLNEQTHAGYLGFSYSKYFPIFSLVTRYGQKKRTYNFEDGSQYANWDELNINTGISLPFNFTRSVYTTKLLLGAGAEYTYIANKTRKSYTETGSGSFTPLYSSLSFINLRRYSWRDFNPKWGQTLALNYKGIMAYDEKYKGYLFSARSSLYFPGILPHNSLKLGAFYERQIEFKSYANKSPYYFSSMTGFPRGYDAALFDKFYKLSADYKFPVWYPDISLGPLAYVKRIRAGAFFDYAKGSLG